MSNQEQKEVSFIRHLSSGLKITPMYYDRNSGEVSYIPENSKLVFTCFDYELFSDSGINHLRRVLNQLPSNPVEFNSDRTILGL
jgi:hypothetical protein